jgi:hypothetical protein
MLVVLTACSFCLLGIALSVSAAVSDKASRDNMRDMTVTGALRRR